MGGWPQRTTWKPALTCVPRAGALDRLHGATPLWSLGAMVACVNQCKPFSIVTPTRANSEGKLQGYKNRILGQSHDMFIICSFSAENNFFNLLFLDFYCFNGSFLLALLSIAVFFFQHYNTEPMVLYCNKILQDLLILDVAENMTVTQLLSLVHNLSLLTRILF